MSNVKSIATNVGERFESPVPKYQAPTSDLTTATKRDNAPAKPLEQLVVEGDALAQKIAEAQKKAQAIVARSAAKREGRTVPAAPRNPKKHGPVIHTVIVGPFSPSDVCADDKEFIVRTRSSDIHTPEMKALFWANGGADCLKAGLGYAAAFSNLRNDKAKSLQRK